MTPMFDLMSVRLIALGGAKASTNGGDQKPDPEDDDSKFN